MSAKLRTISLPDGRKQSNNSYFKLFVHFLHEHTIDDLREQSIQDRRQFNDGFLSPPKIGRREYCSTFLRNSVENSADKKQLEIVTQLENLRSAIENVYRQMSVDSVNDSLKKLFKTLSFSHFWESPYKAFKGYRKWYPEAVDTFEQFGGLYVILDLLFLDHRFRNLEPKLVTSTKPEMTLLARKILFELINKLIYERIEGKVMFLKSEVLLTLLADNYRQHCAIESRFIRGKIARSFKYLAEFKNLYSISIPTLESVDFGSCGIVTSLTETAVSSHTGSDHGELMSSLKAIKPLVKLSSGCRVDFLAVEGSIDMLLDLFGDHGDPWFELGRYFQRGRYCRFFGIFWLLILFFLILCAILFQTYRIFTIPLMTLEVGLLLMNRVHFNDPKCQLASDILTSISKDLHTNERALERFRQRDTCRLLAKYINSPEYYRGRYWHSINILSLMIDGHQRRRMGDIEVEKRCLRELKVEQIVRADWARYRLTGNHYSWESHFKRIMEFLDD